MGETVAKKIAKSFNSIEELENADLEKLTSIDEIGEKIAQSILIYFSSPLNVSLIERLKSAGLQLYRKEEDLNEYTDKLAGQSIVISGVFTHHSRDEYKDLIEKMVERTLAVSPPRPVLFSQVKIWGRPSWKKPINWV